MYDDNEPEEEETESGYTDEEKERLVAAISTEDLRASSKERLREALEACIAAHAPSLGNATLGDFVCVAAMQSFDEDGELNTNYAMSFGATTFTHNALGLWAVGKDLLLNGKCVDEDDDD